MYKDKFHNDKVAIVLIIVALIIMLASTIELRKRIEALEKAVPCKVKTK